MKRFLPSFLRLAPRSSLFVLLTLTSLLVVSPSAVHAGWVQQQSGTTASLSRVFFLDPQTGWACGGSCFVLRTTNGGQLWERDTVDPSILSVLCLWFQDPSLGWTVGAKDSSGHLINQLFTTTDGGIHWQAIYRDTMIMTYFDIEFVTPLKGWLVGSQLYSNGSGKGYLFYTSDGGATWVLRDSCTSTIYWDVSFADSLYGILAAGNPGMSESSGFLKKTTDGGASWQWLCSGLAMFRWVHCLDRNYIWRSAFYDIEPNPWYWGVSKTNDGGTSWTSVLRGGTNAYYAPPVEVIDTLKTWVLGFDTLYRTIDGGSSWTFQFPPGFKQGICFWDSLNGWLVGQNGLILHTTDGGSGVWSEIPRLTPNASRLTFFPNPFTSFATLPGHEAERFALYDISGRRVGVWKGDRVGEGLSPGVYFLRPSGQSGKPLRVVKVR